MLNQILLNLIAVIPLMLPMNIQFVLWNGAESFSDAKEDHQPFAIFDSMRSETLFMSSGENMAPKEEKPVTLEEWKDDFPTYESPSHQTEFIEQIAPAAVLIAYDQGIYPSVMIAQAALESSWGQSDLAQSYNNLMGTKGNTDGKSVTVTTREDQNGQSVYIQAGFTIYDSWADSLSHYGSLMKNGLSWDSEYYNGTWRENTEGYQEATAWLQGRYASDTAYASKLNETIESFDLHQYDDMRPLDHLLQIPVSEMNLDV